MPCVGCSTDEHVFQASRAFGMFEVAQCLQDRQSERTWLRKESLIRYVLPRSGSLVHCSYLSSTSAYIVLLDCCFLFYFGHPTRIALSEIIADLPCSEEIFNDAHPFTRADFTFKRTLTHAKVLTSLFTASRSPAEQTVLDTFISIHCTSRNPIPTYGGRLTYYVPSALPFRQRQLTPEPHTQAT